MPFIRRRKPMFRRKKRVYRRRPLVQMGLLNRRVMSYRPTSKGFFKISRKLPEIYVRNTSVAGVAQVNDPTTTCITLGTPIADAVGGSYSIPFSAKFRLDQLINYTDISNIADQYKITYAQIKMTYQSTSSNVGSNTIMPNLQWIQDHDDIDVSTLTINSLREKMGVKFKTFGFNKICKIGVKPRVQDSVGGAGGVVQNSGVSNKSLWLNTQYTNTEHFGIKGMLSNVFLPLLSSTLTSFKFDVTLWVCAKDIQ